jgi:hypothetical protein
MIVFSESSGVRKSIGYKDLAKSYLEYHGVLIENDFVVNMILMLDNWAEEKGFKFDRIMPSDWDMLLKAVKVLSVEQSVVPIK